MRRRVAVLFGGRSAEHEISCISARSVIDALDPEHVEVVPIGITREGAWRLLPGPPALPVETGVMPVVGETDGDLVELDGSSSAVELVARDGSRRPLDVVFPVLHGPLGEDGAVQGLLELAGIPYVGAGVLGSAIGMDKAVHKALLTQAGVPVAPHVVVIEPEWREDPDGVLAELKVLGTPVFTKPSSLGSSVGIVRAADDTEIGAALDESFRYGRKVVVEAAVHPAREIEVAVLGNDDPVASLPGEVVPRGHGFYDYESKYLVEDGAVLEIPARLEGNVVDALQRVAVRTFTVLQCAGMARVDLFVSGDRIVVNEINTIPGFTSISMYPKLWEASGLAYPDLIERLLDLAEERFTVERAKLLVPRELGGA